jgi:hypothetical protein
VVSRGLQKEAIGENGWCPVRLARNILMASCVVLAGGCAFDSHIFRSPDGQFVECLDQGASVISSVGSTGGYDRHSDGPTFLTRGDCEKFYEGQHWERMPVFVF